MGSRFLLAAALFGTLATVLASPALAQMDLSGNATPPPEYQVKEDGTLIVGGDIEVHCSQVGLDEQYLTADGPHARACEAAGFEITGDGPPDPSRSPNASTASSNATLPETGGRSLPVPPLAAAAALLATGLLALRVMRR
ncbi:MAG TPA: LPXTG cell wall anchor domain-containing protein [Rubrobacteraceae bacterium]|nr:LPXTG cell wall anchor domain-containing protein [Rubrobacteraceae bacterium]